MTNYVVQKLITPQAIHCIGGRIEQKAPYWTTLFTTDNKVDAYDFVRYSISNLRVVIK